MLPCSLWKRVGAALTLLLAVPCIARAQGPPTTTYPSPWTQAGSTVSLTAGTTTSNVQLGGSGPLVVVCNAGSNDAFVALGVDNSVVATTGGIRIPAGQGCINLPGGGQTYLAGITATSTTKLYAQVGNGTYASLLPGGGSGGGIPSPLPGVTGDLFYNLAGVFSALATANNGVLVTNGSGLPSISSTLPSGLIIQSPIIKAPDGNVLLTYPRGSTASGNGYSNVTLGVGAGISAVPNTGLDYLTAMGYNSAGSVSTADHVTCYGAWSCASLTTGVNTYVVSVGIDSFRAVTSADHSAGLGDKVFINAIGLSASAGLGFQAGGNSLNASFITAVGYENLLSSPGSPVTGNHITSLGALVASVTCTSGSNLLLLGTSATTDCATAAESNAIHIGAGSTDIISVTGTNAPGSSATTIAGTLALGGQLSWKVGLGAITQVLGPTDQALAISAGAPAQTVSPQNSPGLTIATQNGVSGSGPGGANASGITITAGSGTRNTSGGGVGGPISLTGGTGIGGGGTGGGISLTGGNAGNGSVAPGSITLTPGTNTNDSSRGSIVLAGPVTANSLATTGTATAAVCQVSGGGVVALAAGCSLGPGSAVEHVSYQPGLLTAVNSTKAVFHKFSKAATVDNIEGSAATFSCVSNPTITVYECGTSTTCATPTTIGSVTVTAAGTVVDGAISSAAITAGDYVAFAMSAGTCASVDVAATVQVHSN